MYKKSVHGETPHQFNDSDLTLQYIFHQIIDVLFFFKLKKKPRYFHTLKLQPSFELWTYYIYDNGLMFNSDCKCLPMPNGF